MTKFIPIFPLNIVVFPSEKLNLHIFEPRYKQLVKECFESNRLFGIPTVLKGKPLGLGTSVKILSIEKEHENGELDIKTEGVDVFNILEIIKEIPDKLYEGAIVNYPENSFENFNSKMPEILKEIKYFHQLLEVQKKYAKSENELISYDVAHHIGMSINEEFEFLNLYTEEQRQEYILRHLKRTIPTIIELQNLKERIQLNGHFRKLSVDE